ncbi:OadG family protein [Alkalitalea saponilacus]|uniref:Na+-transporting methylmalonyl-CoA/oxaloacetate decarboxylase, gamma subunit n=1 Tax=Alkalitalea saponilacus TaxID=889453 RepID=A0A1T5HSW1_9BACT|nr:OadG family protein [Alkalitalea saponilacus]ASB50978.1 hypothetical protein CDL62_18405 [Alkalitalea saponilacus]SKC23778.1 Na+-transporting methylmalonyl-CoA/oxaloacetate decarboxylase, gamma subunit [Alkalitalea saponilacus]
MSENFNEAFTLLGVGMLTVFIILLTVVLLGNGIIFFVNRFFPEKANKIAASSEISSSKTAAIVAAVKILTQGKGVVTKIEKR